MRCSSLSLLCACATAAVLSVAILGCEVAPAPEPEPDVAAPQPAATTPVPATGPNVILVSVDTLRANRTTPYGYERPTSPNLAAFAEAGVRFDQAYSHTPTTGPAHATLLTSLYPVRHGIRINGTRLVDEHETLAEILADAGYATGGFVSSYVLGRRWGWAQGFETYEGTVGRRVAREHELAQTLPCRAKEDELCADEVTDAALEWVAAQREQSQPFFLFLHYMDPHAAYDPPAEFREQFAPGLRDPGMEPLEKFMLAMRAYDGEVAFVDQQFGRLLSELDRMDLADDTLIVFTSDHGECLGDHGLFGHGAALVEVNVRVPLVIRLPGVVPAGKVVDQPVGLVDVLPTILSLIELEDEPGRRQGQDLAPLLRGEVAGDPLREVFFHRRKYAGGRAAGRPLKGEQFGVRIGKWKYVEGKEEGYQSLFDLSADPREKENRIDEEPEVVARLEARVAEWLRELEAGETTVSRKLADDERARLKALGYVD